MKKFSKDIVLVDFEVTGFDLDKDEPIQIGIVILDKKTIEEKNNFVSWVNPNKRVHSNLPGLKWANIKENEIKKINKAPSLSEVADEIIKLIPNKYILCAWNATFDFIFWRKLLSKVDKDRRAAQIFDLWTLAQSKLLTDENYNGDYKSESVFQYFGANPRTKHDALEDCRIEAQLLRKLLNN